MSRRLIAQIIDASVRGAAFVFAILWAEFSVAFWDPPPNNWAVIVSVVALGFFLAYEPFVIARNGCTLGKLMVGVRVGRRSDPSRTPSFVASLRRFALPALLGGALWWFGWAAFGPSLPGHPGDGDAALLEYLVREDLEIDEHVKHWALLNAVFLGPVAGLPLGLTAMFLVDRLRNRSKGAARLGLHDRIAGTVVFRLPRGQQGVEASRRASREAAARYLARQGRREA